MHAHLILRSFIIFASRKGTEVKVVSNLFMQLRSIFKEAATNAPALVFIDEIDAIAAKREDVRPFLSAIVFCETWLIYILIGRKWDGEPSCSNTPDIDGRNGERPACYSHSRD